MRPDLGRIWVKNILVLKIIYCSYPCRWGGIVDGKPLVAGLESFGARALNNLWNSIIKHFPDEVRVDV